MNKQEIEKAISLLKSDIGVLDNYLKKHPLVISHYLEKDRCIENQLIKDMEFTISALEHQLTNGWIPVSERLPEDIKGNGLVTVLACLKSKDDSLFFSDNTVYQEVTDYITDTQEWEIDNGYEVLAWQPLPEPYKQLATDNNVVTIGDKIRESNRSLAYMLGSLCSHGTTDIKTFEMRGWTTKKWLDYLNQPYTDTIN